MSESPFSLAESMDVTNPDSTIRILGDGAFGAAIGALVIRGVEDVKQRQIYMGLIALGMVAMKKPVMAAGLAGAVAFSMLGGSVGMSEEEVEFFDPSTLGEDEPLVLDQWGNALALADGSPASYIPEYLGNGYYSAGQ